MSPRATIRLSSACATMSNTVNIMSYRYGHLAAQAIESVIHQSLPPHVIRFYDDGAGDCAHLPELYPEVEFILRPTNLGIIDNFNDALERTDTDRVMFLGADNWLAPWTLETLLVSEADIISYYGWKVTINDYVPWEINQAHGSSLYDVKQAKAAGGYAASGNEHTEEDSVLFNKMQRAGSILEIIPIPLLYYRWRHRRNYNK